MRNELMKRRIEQTECHGPSVHRFQCPFHVFLHEGEELVNSLPALFFTLAEDYLAEDKERLFRTKAVEHMLGTEETDSLSSEFECHLCINRIVAVGADTHGAVLVNQFHERLEPGIL